MFVFPASLFSKIKAHEGDVKSVIYCAERIDPEIKFTTEACAKLTKIPRVFLKAALTQMADIAKECEIKVIDEQALEIINQNVRREESKIVAVEIICMRVFSA